MARVTRKQWYERVNAAWPAKVPELTGPEAERAARKLYRFVRKRAWDGRVRISSGNRSAFAFEGRDERGRKWLSVNPEAGWKALVHIMSHALAANLPHGSEHARLELRMIKEVIRRGWLDGRLREPEPEPVDPAVLRADRAARALGRKRYRLAKWEQKLKRAETAIRKLKREIKAAERRAAAPPKPAAPRARTAKPEPEGIRMGPAECMIAELALEGMAEWEDLRERGLPYVSEINRTHYRLHLTRDVEIDGELRERVREYANGWEPRERRAATSLLTKIDAVHVGTVIAAQ